MYAEITANWLLLTIAWMPRLTKYFVDKVVSLDPIHYTHNELKVYALVAGQRL
jgi:sulfatase maturation enzyme AslB (radical SAM superfamily)